MNMSFYATWRQFIMQIKEVTRRQGWLDLKAGDRVMGIQKGQGLKKGEKQVKGGYIDILEERWERIDRMITEPAYGRDEVIKEGFPELTPEQFVIMYCKMNKCKPGDLCHRFAFEYVVKRSNASILDGLGCQNPACCDGSVPEYSDVDCYVCEGRGVAGGSKCTNCNGIGSYCPVFWDTCPDCGGSGVLSEPPMVVAEEQVVLL